ncbi:MAG: hypothetical protein K5925_05400 [Bacilli bacterium]|nr:hypothetical protein [Bacilli bacterium]
MKVFLDFLKRAKVALIVLGSLLVATFTLVGIAHGIEQDWGNVIVTSGQISATTVDGQDYQMGYKLYVPKGVDETHPAPAVLCLHGYQNDHETSAGYAIEFARHGYVALAIDEFGHGSTTIGMLPRGYTNHKVSVCYGWDSQDDKTYSFVSGVDRYKLMMNFSNLDFFIAKYSHSVDKSTGTILEEKVKDSSMGGSFAYMWLASQNYVQADKMAVTGHSMGTWAAWSVSAAMCNAALTKNGVNYDITPRATILQAGEIFKTGTDAQGRMAYDKDEDGIFDIYWNNPLLLSAKYDEFNYFRDYYKTPINDQVKLGDQNANFLGVTNAEADFNKTFHENFAAGTSRRRNLYITNHRLLTHNHDAINDTLNWVSASNGTALSIASNNQTFMIKEWLVFFAMMAAIASTLAMIMVFKEIKWFAPVYAGVPNRPEKEKKGWKWWKAALITMGISAVTYPFLTQLGHGLFPFPEVVFSMTIGNGFLMWYIFLIIVMLCFTLIPWFRKKKKGTLDTDFVDLGMARDDEEHKKKFDWVLLGKSAIIAVSALLWMYLQVVLCQAIFQLDLRFIWPFFKGFNWSRLLMFLVYLPIFIIFFVLNNSKIFASNRLPGTNEKGFKAFMKVWWKYALCMVGGILTIVLIEYIPFFLQLGPGADLLFSPTFGGPFMSLLIVFAPQVLVFSVICTFAYRKTGNVFVGALLVAMMACWIVTGGSAILYTF